MSYHSSQTRMVSQPRDIFNYISGYDPIFDWFNFISITDDFAGFHIFVGIIFTNRVCFFVDCYGLLMIIF